ncbi:MAG: dihydroorotate dehydrogenase-like protein [Candidatus Eisenbacteria bacterium]|nr:dihydroorotate dehydrogenase-like protein [Candidatus Eisenbacteria bacterium]
MADLTTTYMGLTLRNPIIVGSSGLTDSADGVRKCEDAGAGAVVLKSIFEEQILAQLEDLKDAGSELEFQHAEAADYITRYGRENAVDHYIRLVRESNEAVDIPVIASVHCVSPGGWVEFVDRVQAAGADAVELNVYVLPSDPTRDGRDYEQVYIDILSDVQRVAKVPVSLKIGSSFSGLARMAVDLAGAGADALVLFNRFARIDFDIDSMKVVPGPYLSGPEELLVPLRWISILSGLVRCDLSASTGVHDGSGVVRAILAGASAVQMCSALYKGGVERIAPTLKEVERWMDAHEVAVIGTFKGRMSRSASGQGEAIERVQFMKMSVGETEAA